MAAAQATGTVPRALPVIPAAEVYPGRDSYHAGEDQRTEREARQLRQSPAQWELRVRSEGLMLAYLAGAPSQRTTALGASIDRHAVTGGGSRMCERCEGGGVLRPKPGEHKTERLLELIDVALPNEPACPAGELIGAPRIRNGNRWVSGRFSRDEDLTDPGSDYAIVKAMAAQRGVEPDDVLRTFEPWCPTCRGNGHIASAKPRGKRVDAQPTGSSKAPWRDHDDRLGELVKFGAASGVMQGVIRESPVFEPVLVAYFGSTGARFAGSVFGKVFAVYPFTSAGQQMLERTKNRAGEADAWERIWSLATDTNRKRNVALLVEAAGTQAVALLQRAGAAWDRAVGPRRVG